MRLRLAEIRKRVFNLCHLQLQNGANYQDIARAMRHDLDGDADILTSIEYDRRVIQRRYERDMAMIDQKIKMYRDQIRCKNWAILLAQNPKPEPALTFRPLIVDIHGNDLRDDPSPEPVENAIRPDVPPIGSEEWKRERDRVIQRDAVAPEPPEGTLLAGGLPIE